MTDHVSQLASPAQQGEMPSLWSRVALLVASGIVAFFGYRAVASHAASFAIDVQVTLLPLLVVTIPYILACWYVWRTAPLVRERDRWIELAVILGIGVVLRMIFWPLPPTISQDAYRYVWDAHQVAHGVSPYAHTPIDPAVAWLRDRAIWPNLNWRDSPTIYPPGAQMFYLLIYKFAPLNIWAMKAGIALCDGGVAVLTIILLRRAGLDARRVLLYWWSPITIIEFAFSAHIDALAVLLTLAALLVNMRSDPRARWAVGILLGLATLTKLYPLLFAVVLVRRRDWRSVLALSLTLVLGYLPFIRLGLGGGGFLSTYFHQRFVDQGFLLKELTLISINLLGGSGNLLIVLELCSLGACAVTVLWWRWRFGLTPAAGILALSAAWILFSPHLFPWYIGALLPFLALVGRLPAAGVVPRRGVAGGSAAAPAVALWLFAVLMPFTYVIFAPGLNPDLFQLFFIVPFVFVAWEAWRRRAWRGMHTEIKRSWDDGLVLIRQTRASLFHVDVSP